MTTFTLAGDEFVLDGRPHRILSGAMHYFRVHPGLWADRIRKAKAMGLNTIETYVPWNLHEPTPGDWCDTGMLDLGGYLDLIADEGMHAIVRPGPYICAEWDNGGLPAWLFADPDVGVRRNEPRYMAAVGDYLRRVYDVVVPRQIDRGGPVLLVQIENEYGAYGDDAAYLRSLVDLTREAGVTVPLTTVDQPEDRMLRAGGLPGVLRTGSFGSRSAERLAVLREHQPTGPLMCSEFWDGWFDHWGAHHHTTSAEESAAELEAVLEAGASVNIYMFHGGTNFGFTSGANDKGVYQPLVTSYDYDAPLDEAGDPTAKFRAFRDVLARYRPSDAETLPSFPAASKPAAAFRVSCEESVALSAVAESLGEEIAAASVPTLDDLDHRARLAVYRARIPHGGVLEVGEVRDAASAFLDGVPIGTLARERHDRTIVVPSGGELSLLVEDRGRVDYGPRIGEKKGLIGPVTLDGAELTDWSVRPLTLDDPAAVFRAVGAHPSMTPSEEHLPPSEEHMTPSEKQVRRASGRSEAGHDPCHLFFEQQETGWERMPARVCGPAFARWCFEAPAGEDLFLDTRGWGNGIAWLNGFCLGRYRSEGPQHTLYVPGPLVGGDDNELIALELRAIARAEAVFVSRPDLGHTEQ